MVGHILFALYAEVLVIFLKPPAAVLVRKGNIIKPAMPGRVDYKAELGLVIGKPVKIL